MGATALVDLGFCAALYRAAGMRDDIADRSRGCWWRATCSAPAPHGMALLPGYLKTRPTASMRAAGDR